MIETQNFPFQRGRSDFDIRQQFPADGTWDVPNNYSSAVVRNILGGWQFGGKWIGQTGLPFTVYTSAGLCAGLQRRRGSRQRRLPDRPHDRRRCGGDYNADGTNYDVPNAPSFGPHLSGQSKSAIPQRNIRVTDRWRGGREVPDSGSRSGRGPWPQHLRPARIQRHGLHLREVLQVPWFFAEKMKIEAKGEVFNLFNRTNLWQTTRALSDSTFGQVTNQLPARSFQVHLRASF